MAAAAFALVARVSAVVVYEGCVAVSSTFDDIVPLSPNGPPACQQYCNGEGYQYFALTQQ